MSDDAAHDALDDGEGSELGPLGTPYADYGMRLGGWAIDFVIMGVFNLAALSTLGLIHKVTTHEKVDGTFVHSTSLGLKPLGSVLWVLFVLIYTTLMVGTWGQTVGMMATKIRAVTPEGGRVSFPRALLRSVVEFALLLAFAIPWMVDMAWPVWDAKNRTLHDIAAKTVVVEWRSVVP